MAFLSNISSKVGEQNPFVVIYTPLDYTGKTWLVTRCWEELGLVVDRLLELWEQEVCWLCGEL